MSTTKIDVSQIDLPGNPNELLAGDGSAVVVGTGLSLAGGTLSGTGGTVTSVNGSAPIASSGGATPTISLNNSGVVAATYTNATITVDAHGLVTSASSGTGGGVASVTASPPLASTGGANPNISISLPGTSTDLLSGGGATAITVGTGLVLVGTTLEATGTGGGITANQHKVLRQLIHLANQGPYEGFASGAYQETLPAAAVFPTSFIWWESAAKLKKIVEETVTYNPTGTIATDQWKVYDTDGVTVLATVTDAITYSGVFELSRTRTIV